MRIGVLALQGDVDAHQEVLRTLGVEGVSVRTPSDLDSIDGLVLPGGESTTMSMLLDSSGLREPLTEWVSERRPTLGTCAGLVLLADRVTDGRDDQVSLGGLDITVQRNGYGRQKFSFEGDVAAPDLGEEFDGVFIRAPRILDVGASIEVLGRLSADGEIVIVQAGAIIGCSFHPELSGDPRLHARLVGCANAGNGPR